MAEPYVYMCTHLPLCTHTRIYTHTHTSVYKYRYLYIAYIRTRVFYNTHAFFFAVSKRKTES